MAPKNGGARQRIQRQQQNQQVKSHLAHYLLCSLAWGSMSPQQVLINAHLAKQNHDEAMATGSPLDEWDALASLGTYGKHPSNCNRDLEARLPTPELSPASQFTVPMKAKSDSGIAPKILYAFGLTKSSLLCIITTKAAGVKVFVKVLLKLLSSGTRWLEQIIMNHIRSKPEAHIRHMLCPCQCMETVSL